MSEVEFYNNTEYLIQCKCGVVFDSSQKDKYTLVPNSISGDCKTKVSVFICSDCNKK